jgi:8-oxo-dGTP diphosphatase
VSESFPSSAVTVDLVILTIRDEDLMVLLVDRGRAPYRGGLALPGGFVRPGEGLAEAAARELVEETGISVGSAHLEQLASYGDPDRDPRMRVVTVAYLAMTPALPDPRPGSDADGASWLAVGSALRRTLAFDHHQILADGVERARAKLEYTPLATVFCPPEFTIAQLRRVYEIAWGTTLDPRNFHRKVTGTPDFIVPVDRSTAGTRGRPAQMYRRGPATRLHPPLLRDD